MNSRRPWAAKAVRIVAVVVSIYVIVLTIGFMSWRRPDALMAFLASRFFEVEEAMSAIAKSPPSPSPMSPSPKPP
jgi:hypothetical protein